MQNSNVNFSRRVLLYPEYLPQRKLGEKPYKNHEIIIPGRIKNPPLDGWKMNPSISDSAKKIIFQREHENIPVELESFNETQHNLESILVSLSAMDTVNKKLDKLDSSLARLSEMDTVNKRLDQFESILMNLLEITEKDNYDDNELSTAEEIQDMNDG